MNFNTNFNRETILDQINEPPIFYYCKTKDIKKIKELIKNGIDLDIKDLQNKKPFDYLTIEEIKQVIL